MGLLNYKKLKRKAITFIGKIYYHNYSYRPVGIYYTSQEYVKARNVPHSAYRQVYPDLESSLSIPTDLYEAHTYLKPKLSVKTNYVVVEVENGRLHTDNACSVAIISDDNKMIADVSFSYMDSQVVAPEKNIIFKQKYFNTPVYYDGVVFTLLTGGSGVNNYGHWMIDVLPRLYLLKQSGLSDKIDFYLVPSYKFDYQRDTLAILGIPAEKIIDGEVHTHIQAKTIIASTAPRGNYSVVPHWTIEFLRNNFLHLVTEKHIRAAIEKANPKPEFKRSGTHASPRIYISRKDSGIRNVLNEDELVTLLKKYDFTFYQLSELSFVEKMSLFATASLVISATGAGLTNILFCKPGTKVLEIFNDGFIVGPFYDIAGKLDLNYRYMICENGSKAKSPEQGQKEHIRVDLKQLELKLKSLLEMEESQHNS